MNHLEYPISSLKGIGPATLTKFHRLGIFNIHDLLFHIPFRYEDYSQLKKVSEILPDQHTVTAGVLELVQDKITPRKRMKLTEAFLSDESGSVKLVWFNMPFMARQLKNGQKVVVYGKPVKSRLGVEFHNPQIKMTINDDDPTIGLVPIYHTTSALAQGYFRRAVESAFNFMVEVPDWLPGEIIDQHKLLPLFEALKLLHKPQNANEVNDGQRRLKFDELFLLMLRSAQIKKYLSGAKAFTQDFKEEEVKSFVAGLPFTLTNDQRTSAWAILKDLAKEQPMNRLLEGDVGSGKTLLAAIALLNTVLNKKQGVLMAPTEILATQHYKTVGEALIKFTNLKIALLTGSNSLLNGQKIPKAELQQLIADGEVDLIIGTHALISDKVNYKDLGLVVIDEQHRFGVEQRGKIKDKNLSKLTPHFLSMTATPIPRSLALIIYGDLDISMLREMPKGRKQVTTKVVKNTQRKGAHQAIITEVGKGRQVFVVCPLIDPSDMLGVKSVTQEKESLSKKIFPNLKIGMLHGKMPSEEKSETMRKFQNKEYDLLVSTSVVEVGVDIPNASVMMIEGAERFGLAQLHQFRGRVGRSEHQSYCFLFASPDAPDGHQERLAHLENSHDGFSLAEHDLKLRGPGEVYGVRQSGMPEMRFASFNDIVLITEVKKTVEDFLERHSVGDFPMLVEKLEEMGGQMHLE